MTVPNSFRTLLYRVIAFLAVLVILRFILEIAGVPDTVTRVFSSTAGLFLAAIYLAAIGPLRGGMRSFKELLLPSAVISAWTVAWVILYTVIAALFRLERSHFATKEDFGNWGQLGRHVFDHIVEILIFFALVFVMMSIIHVLWRWPVTVGPGAVIGVMVVMRYTLEAMGAPEFRAAAWSSTMAVFVSAFFLGAMAPRLGMTTSRQLLAPAFAVAFAWRCWILIATLLSAFVPFYKTHFFDPTQGNVAGRLLRFILAGVIIEGLIAGLIVWGIAVWISCATRPKSAVTP